MSAATITGHFRGLRRVASVRRPSNWQNACEMSTYFAGLHDVLDPSVVPFQVLVQTLSQHPPPVLPAHPLVSDGDTSVRDHRRAAVDGHAHIYVSRALA